MVAAQTRRRNKMGRFAKLSHSSPSRVMHLTSSKDYRTVEGLIGRGPRVIMLIYSTTCPHCVSYMPIWERLCKIKDKKSHMVSMEHSVYSETPMAAKKSVSGVPTVLFVDPKGSIHEESNIRDETNMTNAITSPEVTEDPIESTSSDDVQMLRTSEVSEEDPPIRATANRVATPYPESRIKTSSEENPLPPLPATPIYTEPMSGGGQRGGDPWSAFVAVARQAAPAAALLAAYGLLPKRSSGLPSGYRRRTKRNRSRSRR